MELIYPHVQVDVHRAAREHLDARIFERPAEALDDPLELCAILLETGDDPRLAAERHQAKRVLIDRMTTAFLGSARVHGFNCQARVIKAGRRLIYGEATCLADEHLLTHHTLTYVSSRTSS